MGYVGVNESELLYFPLRVNMQKVTWSKGLCHRILITKNSGSPKVILTRLFVFPWQLDILLCLDPSFSFLLAKHHVNGNRMVEPFPEGTQMALFGKISSLKEKH